MTDVPLSGRPPMDPRLQERVFDIQREEMRRRLRLLLIASGAVLIGVLGWAATRSPVLGVRRVVILGAVRTAPADVARAAGLAHHRQMVDLNTRVMAGAVQALPWVDTVRVVKHWPTGVTISVTERQPVAVVADQRGGTALVDRAGRVLAVVSSAPPGLPLVGMQPAAPAASSSARVLAGEPGSALPAPLALALSVAGSLVAPLSGRVTAALAVPDGGVELSLVGGGTALLGGPDDLGAKLTALATMLSKVRVGRATIDVRVPSAPVLTAPTTGH